MDNLNVAFSGAGFLGIYHIGVVSCLKFYGRKFLENIECFGGSSAGALTACMLLCDMDLDASVQFVMHLASKVHGKILGPLSPEFEPCESIRKTYMTYLPSDAYKRATGKLFISLTRVSDWENVIVSEFESNKELVDALVCTSFIPFFSGILPPKFKGVSYIDGGFTDNMPQHFSGTTITISPFSGESDICPNDAHKSETNFDMRNTSILVTSHNIYRMSRALFPPDNDVLSDMCRQGYRDTLKYLNSNYPEMLSFDVTIVSIPRCCDSGNQYYTSDDEGSLCSCGNTTNQSFSDMEHTIAKGNAIENLVVVPEQLNAILLQTKELFQQSDLCWYLIKALSNIAHWLIKPCYYAVDQIYVFVKELFNYLLPKITELSQHNFYTKKALGIAVQVIEAYYETSHYQWHPSIGKQAHDDINKTKQRLLTAQKSLVTLPKIGTEYILLESQSQEAFSSGLNPPPPSRVSSFSKLTDFDLVTKINEYVFDESGLLSDGVSSSDALLEDEDVAEESVFCEKDDDGLIMKLDRNLTTLDPDDYGSELLIIPDAACDAFVIGKTESPGKLKGGSTDSWDDFIEITGVGI